MKREIILNFIDGTEKRLLLSKATKLNLDGGMLHLDKFKDESWRLIWSTDLIDDFSTLKNIEIYREDYKLNAITLTARDMFMINKIMNASDYITHDIKLNSLNNLKKDFFDNNTFGWFDKRDDGTLKSNLERQEFEEKVEKLGIDVPWKDK